MAKLCESGEDTRLKLYVQKWLGASLPHPWGQSIPSVQKPSWHVAPGKPVATLGFLHTRFASESAVRSRLCRTLMHLNWKPHIMRDAARVFSAIIFPLCKSE